MRFKEYLVNEGGLGNLGFNLERPFQHDAFSKFSGALVNSDQTGSDAPPTGLNQAMHMPNLDMTIPEVRKSGRIAVLQTHKSPIYVRLTDGTEAYFTIDEFRRIKGEPQIGKVMTLSFQRHPGDRRTQPSKIERVEITD
jgi:hypothetical protein